METVAPGRIFLIITGILFSVLGIVNLLASGMGLAADYYWDDSVTATIPWNIYYTVTLVGALFHIPIGVIGIAYSSNLKKSPILRTLGVVCIGYGILDVFLILFVFSGVFSVLTLVGLAIPILYLVGAQKNVVAYGG